MKINKQTIILLIVIFISVVAYYLINQQAGKAVSVSTPSTTSIEAEQKFLLEGYPVSAVPLYKLKKISSNKIFVNTDPKNISEFDENKFAYYNVVFSTEAGQEEFLSYYKKLFDTPITDEYESTDTVKGKIGEYRVSATHYGSNDTGYLRVYLQSYNDENLNSYFVDFPQILDSSSFLTEHEKSYGLLNQKGGEIEFTKYFTVTDSGDTDNDGKDDVDEFGVLEQDYQKQYSEKPEYVYDDKTGIMKWKDDGYESTLTISRKHNRIYLVLRHPATSLP